MRAPRVGLVVSFLAVSLLSLGALAPRASAQVPSITLQFTAPGDDSTAGTASSYEIRWRAGAADTTGQAAWLASGARDANVPTGLATFWSNATRYLGAVPAPKPAGSAESLTLTGPGVGGVWPSGTYSFQIRTCDDGLPAAAGATPIPNCSRSNVTVRVVPLTVAQDLFAPAAIRDLKAQ